MGVLLQISQLRWSCRKWRYLEMEYLHLVYCETPPTQVELNSSTFGASKINASLSCLNGSSLAKGGIRPNVALQKNVYLQVLQHAFLAQLSVHIKEHLTKIENVKSSHIFLIRCLHECWARESSLNCRIFASFWVHIHEDKANLFVSKNIVSSWDTLAFMHLHKHIIRWVGHVT